MNTVTSNHPGIDEWLDLIRRQEMPIFNQTARRVISLSADDGTPMSELAAVILQDPSMTARVLKLANSILYNPTTTSINTVTRAVIVLGFNAVRNICLTLTLVDTLLKGSRKERLARELGRAMHAAIQARAVAAARGDKSPEEVFIATLLYRVGELAFWCFGGTEADRVEHLIQHKGVSPEEAQERILGFRLGHLTRTLVREWHLTDLLQEAAQHPARQDPRIQSVMIGQQVARCAAEQGWQSEAMTALFQKAAKLTALPTDKVRSLMFREARAAADAANHFGAAFAAPHIPQPREVGSEESNPGEAQAAPPRADADTRERDSKLQAEIMRELTAVLKDDSCSFNVIMELVLEGIFKGVGVDRVLFALTTPDKAMIKAKYALGPDGEELSKRFTFKRPDRGQSALFQTLDHKRACLIHPDRRQDTARDVLGVLPELSGSAPFMLAPIVIEDQSIGLFYADRALSKRPIDRDSFEDFKHFVSQANNGLTLASVRRRQ